MHPDDYDFQTHAEYLASTGGGKTKGAGVNSREDVKADCGVDVIDWKSTLCADLLSYLCYYRPTVPIVDLCPAKYALPFNVFASRGEDPDEHAVRMTEVLLKCRGEEKGPSHPMLEQKLPMLLSWCALTGETIQKASRLLHFHNRGWWAKAAEFATTEHLRDKCLGASIVSERDWDYHFGSTVRKLEPFLHEGPLKRCTDTEGCFDYAKLRAKDGILLVDLKGLTRTTGQIFAALAISEMLYAVSRATDEIPRFAYLDEPQEYETADMASLLNLSRSSGLRVSLIHHCSAQWKDPAMATACEVNARIKYVMHGVPFSECRKFAEEKFIRELNQRLAKEIKYRTERDWLDEDVESVTERDDGSTSRTVSPRLRIMEARVEDGQIDYTYQEKLSMLTEPLVTLPKRAYCKFSPDGYEWGEFPTLEDHLHTAGEILQFRESFHPPSAHVPKTPNKTEGSSDAGPKKSAQKKPVRLHHQG